MFFQLYTYLCPQTLVTQKGVRPDISLKEPMIQVGETDLKTNTYNIGWQMHICLDMCTEEGN